MQDKLRANIWKSFKARLSRTRALPSERAHGLDISKYDTSFFPTEDPP